MDDEMLSQSEIESLLSATHSHAAAPPRHRAKVSTYDFKRPVRGNGELTRTMQALHEGFVRNFGAALSALLRATVEVKLASVLQLTSHEFSSSLENPTCLHILRAEPLEGNLILQWNLSILFPLIDRLLGGGKDSGPIARRPLTEIEQRLASRITALFLQEWKLAWEHVAALTLSIERFESNPQLVQFALPTDAVIVVSFEAAMGEACGSINLCIPLSSLECVRPKLWASSESSENQSRATPHSRAIIAGQLDRSLVDVVVTVAETQIGAADLMGLAVGDVITTDKDIRAPLDVAVQGINKFQASAGALKGIKAIRIETVPSAAAEDLAQTTAEDA